jgi:hypothetical protein
MTADFVLIETKAPLGSAAASVAFNSIPATYAHLKVVTSGRSPNGAIGTGIKIALNGTAASSGKIIYSGGSGSAITADSPDSAISPGNASTANVFGNCEIIILDYLSSIAKNAIGEASTEANSADAYLILYAPTWSGVTAAVTSMTLTHADASNFMAGSTFFLYGIKN